LRKRKRKRKRKNAIRVGDRNVLRAAGSPDAYLVNPPNP
jgi:hypothetical protein